MSGSENWKQQYATYLNNRGKIRNWIEMTEAENWAANHEEQQKNREAESAWTRKELWGNDGVSGGEEEMRQTVLGDINNPAPIVVPPAPQPTSGLAQIALPLALGLAAGGIPTAAIGGAALATYLNRPQSEQPSKPITDETVGIGLGKIEDYLKPESP